jgi:hypothetical protein
MSKPELPIDGAIYDKILEAVHYVVQERLAQNKTWGEQNHDPFHWITILGEEFGEFCHDILEEDGDKAMVELVQVAAVSIAMIECGLRCGWGKL